jgi:hypothetical protein
MHMKILNPVPITMINLAMPTKQDQFPCFFFITKKEFISETNNIVEEIFQRILNKTPLY